jgi:hypothetical protein
MILIPLLNNKIKANIHYLKLNLDIKYNLINRILITIKDLILISMSKSIIEIILQRTIIIIKTNIMIKIIKIVRKS